MTPMSSIPSRALVAHRGELGTGDGTASDAQLACDRLGGDRVVAGDHAHLDARVVRLGDGRLGLGSRRVHDAHQRQHRQVADERQEVGRLRVEGRGIEVAHPRRHHPQALPAKAFVL